ncbi:hypothetical protein [Tardiphaga sp.]|uniref:hypothetical protein n=1 Tax=Tardiphaga sp. TaxID=1926292 RepID=UPI00352A7509
MRSSIRYPAGAQVAFHALDAADAPTWARDYARLIEDVRVRASCAFPSFDPVDCWRDCNARVILRNAFADIGVTTDDGRAAIWMARRSDPAYRLRCEWGDTGATARAWLERSAAPFAALFGPRAIPLSDLPLAA